MGNKGNYVIGGAISALAIAITIVAIIPAMSETPTASTGLNALGHLTLTIYDPDGNLIGYRQTDNFVTDGAINALQAGLFTGGAFNAEQFKWLALCEGDATAAGATGRGDNACTAEMDTDRIDGDTGSTSTSTGAAGSEDIFSGTITLILGDDNVSFKELALFDAQTVGDLFSVATFTEFLGQTGTVVTAKYTITMAG